MLPETDLFGSPPTQGDNTQPVSARHAEQHHPIENGGEVRIKFTIPYKTRFGQTLVVVGNLTTFGAWDPLHGVQLAWREGDLWQGEVALTFDVCMNERCDREGNVYQRQSVSSGSSGSDVRRAEYVYCVIDSDPNVAVVWEYGEHRRFPVDAAKKGKENGYKLSSRSDQMQEIPDGDITNNGYMTGLQDRPRHGLSPLNTLDCRDWWRPAQDHRHVQTRDMFAKTMMPPDENHGMHDFPRAKCNGQLPVLRFNFLNARINTGHRIGVVGNIAELGNWDTSKALMLYNKEHPMWRGEVMLDQCPEEIEYRYIIVDANGECVKHEVGDNRLLDMKEVKNGSMVVVSDLWFRFDTLFRTSGVAVPVFSLRTEKSMGVGEFLDIKLLADWCSMSGLKVIQLLPVNDTNSTNTWIDSYPYAPYSVFALHPLYANMERIGPLSDSLMQEVMQLKGQEFSRKDTVDYEGVLRLKLNWFKRVFHDCKDRFLESKQFRKFFKDNEEWLVPYGVFSYLKENFQTCDFRNWGKYSRLKEHEIWELADPKAPQYTDIARFYFIQYHCHMQLCEAIQYARAKGISVKGDIPIGIFRFSVDAWMYPHLFDQSQQMGTPPDAFTDEGQNWHFPAYRWENHVKENFAWWQRRLFKMAEYYDLFRIDHVLGFFRLWVIDNGHITGLMGHFEPNQPISLKEIQDKGIAFDLERYCRPYLREHVLQRYFTADDVELVKSKYLDQCGDGIYKLKEIVNTQMKVDEALPTVHDMAPNDFIRNIDLKKRLLKLHGEIIFHEKVGSNGKEFFPRFAPWLTQSFDDLDTHSKHMISEMFHDFQWVRNDGLWAKKALEYLLRVEDATNMLVCAEDLGTVPISSPGVLDSLNITRLIIQRLPLAPGTEWWDLTKTPYLAVVSPGTHDMPTIRQWWELQRDKAERFFRYGLGHIHDEAPYFCEPWVVKEIIWQHMASPSMLSIIPIQDFFGIDGKLRRQDPHAEQINHCENLPYHYWRYRMHVTLETLLGKEGEALTKDIRDMVVASGRHINY